MIEKSFSAQSQSVPSLMSSMILKLYLMRLLASRRFLLPYQVVRMQTTTGHNISYTHLGKQ